MRILVVAGRHPFPPRRGDELRALQCATSLASRHQVTLLVPESPFSGTIPLDLPFRVETFSRRRAALPAAIAGALALRAPIQNAFFAYPGARASPRRAAAVDGPHRPPARAPRRGACRRPTVAPVIVDLIDSLSLNFASRARRDRPWLRPLLDAEARRVARCEESLLERARGALVVCDRDRHQLERRLDPALHGRLRTVPIAVDGYRRRERAERRSPTDTLVFSGNFGYFVNRDALLWFLRRVWPRPAPRAAASAPARRRLARARPRCAARSRAPAPSWSTIRRTCGRCWRARRWRWRRSSAAPGCRSRCSRRGPPAPRWWPLRGAPPASTARARSRSRTLPSSGWRRSGGCSKRPSRGRAWPPRRAPARQRRYSSEAVRLGFLESVDLGARRRPLSVAIGSG